jgi:hypothetical protein
MLDLNALKQEHQKIKEQAARASGGGSDEFFKKFVKMPDGKGTVTVRLLPPAKDGMFGRKSNPFYQWTRLHTVNNKKIHDPRELVGKKWIGENPIADYLRALWKDSETAAPDEQMKMRKLYRDLKPVERYYYNCIVREEIDENGNKKQNVGPKILSVGKMLHEEILKGICGDEELGISGLGDVSDPKAGYDFKIIKTIRKSPDGIYPNYEGSGYVQASTPLGNPEEVATWLDNLHDLVALRVLKSYEEIDHELQLHLGVIVEDTKFDYSRYQKKQDRVVVQKEAPSARPSVQNGPEDEEDEPDVSDEGTDVLADEEFLKELKGVE